jgi:hypothetical protein
MVGPQSTRRQSIADSEIHSPASAQVKILEAPA